ncbi:PepSY-associated TM helix domain-containing protein [Nocardioides hwasunensis]|uniref:PepSY domain-containing protein n=1 Tax=Nocardioides hwasunensis TaxID=397258 RepID=A0ABR8MF30_9ACTN|nr:PepSY domain-containing protein [Nocardioides hwasunensis]MBD3913079.1 PepSY domain-containing protein [Nocardioides hwasunensis]
MTTLQRPRTPSVRPRVTPSGLFRAFWRWHFYASFVVVPIFAVLAVTGLIYLLRFQLEPLMHGDLMKAEAPAGQQLPYVLSDQLDIAQAAYPDDEIGLIREGRGPDDTTAFAVTKDDGTTVDVFVDPWRGEVLGELDPDTTLSGYAVRLHADLMGGVLGDRLIEVAVCWAIVMSLTGYYLFFAGRKARLRRRTKKAPGAKLRSRHALVGSVAGVGLLMMVVTGLPWTGFWGAKVQEIATSQGTSMWSLDHGAESQPGSRLDESLPHSHAVREVPWAQGATEVPSSDPDGADLDSVANVDTAVVVAEREGLTHPMTIALPSGNDGVFSVIGDAFHDPSRERTVHVDQYSGEVRSQYGFDDYPLAAKAVAQGIGLHEGRSLGLVSFWFAFAFCVAVLFMCVSGPLMWWRRRPARSGSMGAPRGKMPVRATWWLVAALAALGIFLPLFGVTLLAVLAFDQLVLRRVPRLRAAFDTVD